MKTLKNLSVMCFISIMTSSCLMKEKINGDEIVKSLREVKSINGDVIYGYDLNSGEWISVFKYSYMKLPNYRIVINRDSLEIGDTLICEVTASQNKSVSINIESPKEEIYNNSTGKIRKLLKYRVDTPGESEFRGRISIDTNYVSFVYKFYVKSDSLTKPEHLSEDD